MKINRTTFYSSIFSFVLLSQVYLPSFKLNIAFQLLALLYFISTQKVVISYSYIKLLSPLLILLLFPIFIGVVQGNSIANIIKDLSYFLKPTLGLILGYIIFKKINNIEVFVKTVVFSGLISALIHFVILIFFTNLMSGEVSQIREYGKDNFLELFSLFVLLTHSKFTKDKLFSKKAHYFYLILLSFSCLMYLSRTMLIVGIILYLSIKGYTLIRYRSIKIIAIIISIVLLFYVYLFSVKIDRNAKGFEGFLYKMKIAPSEIFLSKIDRENHKDLWDHWRGYEANRAFALMKQSPSSYLVGTGFGSLIDLKFNSPLGDQKKGLRYISEIHNGYVFVLYKTGIIGLLLLLIFLINLYLKGYHRKNFIFIMISSISVTYFFTTLTITGIFNKRDIIILLLGAFLYYGTKNEQIVQADESK
ncbi:MAG: O-antigen ligase family protein [Flavobacterium sp.]|jgi:hypothetical protein|nr:O-antigen ligase family protein [Flavobacterium sp.]